jgi:MFS family permease
VLRGRSAGYSLYSLAQQTYVRLSVPPRFRGRVLASVGGTYRVGGLLAPLCGGVLAQRFGFRPVFAVQLLACAPALPLIAFSMHAPLAPAAPSSGAAAAPASDAAALKAFLRANWRAVGAAWVATLLMSLVRSVRDLLLPLASQAAGLSRAQTGYITAASYAGDTLLFPIGGLLMDRHGCWLAGAVSCGTMAVGLLPLTTAVSGAAAGAARGHLLAAAIITGVGNGLSSGIVMALGADMAPAHLAGSVLGAFNFVAAAGGVIGPLIVGALAQAAGLRAAAFAAAFAAALGAAWWGLMLPRPNRARDAGGAAAAEAEGVPMAPVGRSACAAQEEGAAMLHADEEGGAAHEEPPIRM